MFEPAHIRTTIRLDLRAGGPRPDGLVSLHGSTAYLAHRAGWIARLDVHAEHTIVADLEARSPGGDRVTYPSRLAAEQYLWRAILAFDAAADPAALADYRAVDPESIATQLALHAISRRHAEALDREQQEMLAARHRRPAHQADALAS